MSSSGSLVQGLALTLALAPVALGQGRKAEDDGKPLEVDPYTDGDPATVAAAGYRFLGSSAGSSGLLLSSGRRTTTIEEALGMRWMLWAETPHFQIGCALGARTVLRGDRRQTEAFEAELDALRDKGLDLPRKVKELDPWLQLHLFAHRLEAEYASFVQRFEIPDDRFPAPPEGVAKPKAELDRSRPGPYLGSHGKFMVLLFDQKADLARYLNGFLGVQHDTSYRSLLVERDVNVFATAREPYSVSVHEAPWFHCHVVGNLHRMLLCAYRGYRFDLPLWFVEGYGHWTTRRLDPSYFSPTVAAGQDADSRRDPEWEDKVYGRVSNDYYPAPRELMSKEDPRDFAFADHLMSWSWVDFLLSRPGGHPGAYLERMKRLPWSTSLTFEHVLETQEEALKEAWDLELDTMATPWTEWVRKEYSPRNRKKRRG